MIDSLRDRVISGHAITKTEAVQICALPKTSMSGLFAAANKIRQAFRGDSVDLCAIVNAKSGACPEDCSYCAQSSRSKTETAVYPLINKNAVIEKAKEARDAGVKRFCIVTSGRKTGKNELKEICSMIKDIRGIGLLPCSTLGLLNKDELTLLKDSGLERYHHNLETSERFFPEICRTHTYSDKLKTIDAAITAGLSVCSGGIFGIGETWEDRIDMAFTLKKLPIASVPINYLIPVKGTPMGEQDMLNPFEALKIVSLYRFILPQKEIRICGGRMQVLGEFNSMVFMAGADSLLTGNYLTTTGRTFSDDQLLIKDYGLRTD
ncbi:MAG: biotin synthase BioB [Thermodesulfovibrionales bacterium]|nr:biotin synthase BioB [Thermodesulfovibrionales bacterium]